MHHSKHHPHKSHFYLKVLLFIGLFFALNTFAIKASLTFSFLFYLLFIGAIIWFFYRAVTKPKRLRNKLSAIDFPAEWKKILNTHVAFYRGLTDSEKVRFEKEVQLFLSEKRITGIDTKIDDSDKILVACSAVIPVFGFKEWHYHELEEVLLYPASFNQQYETAGKERNVLGMVGNGYMNGVMILSLPDLHQGFDNFDDKKNVGIHEFVHILDKEDGSIDGVPEAIAEHSYAIPWLKLVHSEIQKIIDHKSDINPYGATNEQEFFAVASEYFFERPELMQEKHPELYTMLKKIYQQDVIKILKNAFTFKKTIGRNDPCPCRSGKKFKRCCGIEYAH